TRNPNKINQTLTVQRQLVLFQTNPPFQTVNRPNRRNPSSYSCEVCECHLFKAIGKVPGTLRKSSITVGEPRLALLVFESNYRKHCCFTNQFQSR
ncbi:hypothetical protein CEXT_631581, partial [Caerostris extrusa]